MFQQLASESPDPGEFLRRCWATGKVPHRQLVASFLKENAAANPSWFRGVEPLVLAGTVDADTSVREISLATLQICQDPRLFDQARAQLNDLDPLVRQLGLGYLRMADAQRAVPLMIPLLDDTDLRVVTRAEAALMRWTGTDFGVRVRMAIHSPDEAGVQVAEKADEQKIREGVARRKQWWSEHAAEFPRTTNAAAASQPPARGPVEDFALRDPTGKQVRLAEFRGQVVVLNFWATWCTACLAEIPDLAALHKEMGERIAVIGVALDGLPDEHQHDPGNKSEAEEHSVGKPLNEIQKKVLRTIKALHISYPVLLDPTGTVGGRFNGGELPTTVILDARGQMRRRFIGERSLAVFEAMVNEASKP
jgi:thiol-disulfide isomerase/thioredoxin